MNKFSRTQLSTFFGTLMVGMLFVIVVVAAFGGSSQFVQQNSRCEELGGKMIYFRNPSNGICLKRDSIIELDDVR
jgi:hypothetical protein